MLKIKKTLIVAADENGCIGKDGKLPWHFKEDMQWFKDQTIHHAVLMGRITFESILKAIKKPLSNRLSIVVSSSRNGEHYDEFPDVRVVNNVYEGIASAGRNTRQHIFIAGGAQLYEYSLRERLVDRILLTKVKGFYDGDTFFPDWPLTKNGWVASRQVKQAMSPELSFWEYVRA